MPAIQFFYEGIDFKVAQSRKIKTWIKASILKEKKTPGNINFIYCSDEHLHKINLEYLDHDTLTDIITFDNSDVKNLIEGDIFISVDRIKENAKKFGQAFEDELHRVIIHGVLHLVGYSDKSTPLKKVMRKKEDAYLSLR